MDVPGPGTRTLIIGQTGSGKTQAGLFLLSLEDWTERSWIILDYKGDEGIAQIPGTKIISLNENLGKLEPGIFILRPMIWQTDEVEAFLWRVWETENLGLYLDEGYMIPKNSEALRALLVQGRSKKITMISLTQRPVEVTRFLFSESSYFQIFDLIDKRDRKTVEEFVPIDFKDTRLERYHSLWYDVADKKLNTLAPVPELGDILAIYQSRLPEPAPKRRKL